MRKTGIIFAGVILSLILFSGITVSSYSDYLSPKKQIESGVLPEDVTCKVNRILVIRDSGSPACVTEKTAEKKGWVIVGDSHTDEMIARDLDEHTSTKTHLKNSQDSTFAQNKVNTIANGSPSIDIVDFEISTLPKLDETATISITTKHAFPMHIEPKLFGFAISDNFEFVDVEPTNTKLVSDGSIRSYYKELFELQPNELKTIQVTVRAIDEGLGEIRLFAFDEEVGSRHIVIGKNQTEYFDPTTHQSFVRPSQNAVTGSNASPIITPQSNCATGFYDILPKDQLRQILQADGISTQEDIEQFMTTYESDSLRMVGWTIQGWACQGYTEQEIEGLLRDSYDGFVLDLVDSYDGFVLDTIAVNATTHNLKLECDTESKHCHWINVMEDNTDLSTQNFFLPSVYATSGTIDAQ